MDLFFALAASFTDITLESIWLTSAEAGVPMEGVVYLVGREDRPSCELGEESSFAGWEDGDLEGL